MARTIEQVKQEHSRLQTALNSTPADKETVRNQIMGDMRKLEAEHESLVKGGNKNKSSSPMVMYMVIGAIVVIAISFGAAYLTGANM